jgi:hypothetical protein
MYDFTILLSCFDSVVVPLNFLTCEFVLLIMPCLLPACADITFPVAEILNLFFAELLVFNFGIIEWTYTNIVTSLQPLLSLIKAE